MIHSMTGFGEAQLEQDGHVYHLELRSVNNRYFKAAIYLPDDFNFLEPTIEQKLRSRLIRGSVSLRLHIRDLSAGAAQDINQAAITHYLTQLKAVAGDDARMVIDLATLAALPGVCQPRELSEQQRQAGAAVVDRLLDEALKHLLAMRAAEGQTLAEDLRRHCRTIAEQLDAIRQHVPQMLVTYRDRLKARVEELLAGSNVQLASDDLLKEVSVYAERSDISEELSRLGSHLQQFEQALVSREPAGRKLEFIAQEMLREANTIGSKAGDAQVAQQVIEIKGAIDRIKEQVQNAV